MDEELAYKVLAYLIAHYKTYDETIINKEEIDAINFILDKNEQQKDIINKTKEFIKNQQKEFIEWLEENIKACELTSDLIFNHNKEKKIYKEIISKYKQIEKLGLIEKE